MGPIQGTDVGGKVEKAEMLDRKKRSCQQSNVGPGLPKLKFLNDDDGEFFAEQEGL